MARQQYQRLETRGNPWLEALELVAAGLNSELLLIPAEKLSAVLAVLGSDEPVMQAPGKAGSDDRKTEEILGDPWKGLLGDKE